jgi:gluconokinase
MPDRTHPRPDPTTTIVVMGVAGCGKSTVMAALAERLGWATAEGDEFHSPAAVEKMRSGHPLTDDDRWPWLDRIAAWIGEREAAGENALITCSALRRAYRDRLGDGRRSVWFAHLVVPPSTLAGRLEQRQGHYMPPSLLASQLETLEPLEPDESGAALEANRPPAEIVTEILGRLRT